MTNIEASNSGAMPCKMLIYFGLAGEPDFFHSVEGSENLTSGKIG